MPHEGLIHVEGDKKKKINLYIISIYFVTLVSWVSKPMDVSIPSAPKQFGLEVIGPKLVTWLY